MKTLTKKELLAILDRVSDETPIYIHVEPSDVEAARRNLPEGATLLQFGLPGDHAIDNDGIGLLTWSDDE